MLTSQKKEGKKLAEKEMIVSDDNGVD